MWSAFVDPIRSTIFGAAHPCGVSLVEAGTTLGGRDVSSARTHGL